MSDIRHAIQHMEEPEKSILTMLLNYHEEMKRLESDIQKGGKQATLTVMTVNDFKKLINDGKTKTVSS
jgi:GGDEF domain-containing protein